MIGPFTTLSITREVARIIEVQNLKLDGFQLRENLHQSVSVKLCWWETKQVCILMSNVNLEGWNFGSFFFAYWSTRHWLGLSECCWWKKSSTEMTLTFWNHMKSCQLSSRTFFQWISDWELAPSLASCFAFLWPCVGVPVMCHEKRGTHPLELGTYRATSFTVYFLEGLQIFGLVGPQDEMTSV